MHMNTASHSKWPTARPELAPEPARPMKCSLEMFDGEQRGADRNPADALVGQEVAPARFRALEEIGADAEDDGEIDEDDDVVEGQSLGEHPDLGNRPLFVAGGGAGLRDAHELRLHRREGNHRGRRSARCPVRPGLPQALPSIETCSV